MTSFWIVVSALAFIASLFVALPLLKSRTQARHGLGGKELRLSVYRDHLEELRAERRAGRLGDEQYTQARGELDNRLLEEVSDADASGPFKRTRRPVAIMAMIGVPMLASLIYLALGNPAALRPQDADGAHGLGQQQMDALIVRLAERLDQNPQDAKGWVMLARAQYVLGRFHEASAAYAKLTAMFPDDAQLLADYADALAMTQGRSLAGEPERLVARALHADPNNAKALALAGAAAFDNKDFILAIRHWERLRDLLPTGSEFAESIQRSIDEAKTPATASGAMQQASSAPGSPLAPERDRTTRTAK